MSFTAVRALSNQHSPLSLQGEGHRLLGQEPPSCQNLLAWGKENGNGVTSGTTDPLCQRDYDATESVVKPDLPSRARPTNLSTSLHQAPEG